MYAVSKSKRLWSRIRCVPVFRVLRAGLNAIGRTFEANLRIYLGVWVILVVAPIAGCCYQFFSNDKSTWDKSWYHLNHYHLFYLIGPQLFLAFTLIGIFFLFPSNSRRAYFLSIPLGQILSKLFCLITAQSNEDIYRSVVPELMVAMICASVVLFICFDWLMDRQYHKLDGIKARIAGLDQIDIPSKVREKLSIQEKDRLYNFQKQY